MYYYHSIHECSVEAISTTIKLFLCIHLDLYHKAYDILFICAWCDLFLRRFVQLEIVDVKNYELNKFMIPVGVHFANNHYNLMYTLNAWINPI